MRMARQQSRPESLNHMILARVRAECPLDLQIRAIPMAGRWGVSTETSIRIVLLWKTLPQ